MRLLLIALLMLIPAALDAATPEQTYLSLRDRAIKALKVRPKPGESEERRNKQHDAALAAIEKPIQLAVGPFEYKGLEGPAKSNVDSLDSGDVGYDMLDGLVLRSADYKTSVVATTESLFRAWLKGHRSDVPQTIDKAIKDETFYTRAISSDSAVSFYTEIPIAKPAGATLAHAELAVQRQAFFPSVPDDIFITVVRNGRVYVIKGEVSPKLEPITACQAVWDETETKVKAAFEEKNKKTVDDADAIEEKGDKAFRKCFGDTVREMPAFKAIVQQAQALVDRLPVQ